MVDRKDNIFTEPIKSEPYIPQEVDDIQAKLDKQLGPEYVSTRPGNGGVRVSYIEGWKVIKLANQVFGFNGWNSEIRNVTIDYCDHVNGRFNIGISAVVRVSLKDGTFHEDVGYGSLDNARTKQMGFEKAKKEAVTDSLKRTLRCYGNAMGNCLYDKEYLSKISGIKCAPPDFDESNLIRYTDGPQVSRAPTLPAVSNTYNSNGGRIKGAQNVAGQRTTARAVIPEKRTADASLSSSKRPIRDNDDAFDDSLTFSDDLNLESEDFNDEVNALLNTKPKSADPESELHSTTNQENFSDNEHETNTIASRDTLGKNNTEVIKNVGDSEADNNDNENTDITITPSQVGFFKARVAEEVQKNGNAPSTHAFNPQFISPSIRRTLDPTKSTPVKRTQVSEPKSIRYDNPKLIPNRQVGKPRYPPSRLQRTPNGNNNINSANSSQNQIEVNSAVDINS